MFQPIVQCGPAGDKAVMGKFYNNAMVDGVGTHLLAMRRYDSMLC
jgi:hypothetical protein